MSNLENPMLVLIFSTACGKQQQIFDFLNSTGTNWWATKVPGHKTQNQE